jgi:predicted nucleic acid-binding protein
MWKCHILLNYPVDNLLHKVRHLIEIVDMFINAEDLYEEAIPLACKLKHPTYGIMYLIVSRRKNATLVTLDEKLVDAAKKLDIPVAMID